MVELGWYEDGNGGRRTVARLIQNVGMKRDSVEWVRAEAKVAGKRKNRGAC